MNKIKYIFLLGILMVACDDDGYGVSPVIEEVTISENTEVYTSGTADFSTYVAVGNSLTAGYSDGALFTEGQDNSSPNILSQQFSLAGGGEFTQPYMNDNVGGLLLGGQQIAASRLYLSFATGSPSPTPINETPTTDVTNILAGPFNNMGVPGAKSFHLMASGYGNVQGVASGLANPYYARMATSPGATIIDDAVSLNASFFSLWIGNNDILGFAISGGQGVNQLGNYDAASYGSNDITDPIVFGNVYNSLLQSLTANGAKGIVSNLPSVTSIPYFNTVPYNAIPLDAVTATALNMAFAEYNAGLQFVVDNTPYLAQEEADARMVNFVEGQNAALILDEDLTDLTGLNPKLTNMRQATENDLFVLTSRTFLGTVVNNNPQLINGVSVPLEDKWVLTPQEQEAISTAQIAFNQTIESLASQYDIAFFDVKQTLNNLVGAGIVQNGITTTATYATGGGFSLDGVHPSPRGYAIIVNGMIDVINSKYESNLPKVDISNYKGLYID